MKINEYIRRNLKDSPYLFRVLLLQEQHGAVRLEHSRIARGYHALPRDIKAKVKDLQRRMVEIENEIKSLIP